MSYGVLVEGPYDSPVYRELIRKITSARVEVFAREAGGVSGLMRLIRVTLRDLEHVMHGRPVDKALVIRDSGGREPQELEEAMQDRVGGAAFSFPRGIKVHAVRRAMETWLLADIDAINAVATSRGGRQVAAVQGALEEILDPKERLKHSLSEARLPYDPEVCRGIAERARIETLRYRCPSFVSFERKVIDC
ncbi:MAG: DUF4276 family protein [candidate division NC10 bacterium]|nr:DUF4276 family protein [candidate division NC10 bacterium]